MFIYLPTLITFVCALYLYFTRTFDFWKKRNVKGPCPIPFFGNYIDVFFRRKHIGVLYHDIYKQYPDEKVVGLYRMMSPTLLIRDLDIVKQVLQKDFESFPDRGVYYSKQKLGNNLFHADVEVMKGLRKHMTAAFTPNKFKANFNMLANRAEQFLEYMGRVSDENGEVNILPVFRKYGADSIMMAAFGIDLKPYDENNLICDVLDEGIQYPRYLLELELLFPGSLTRFDLSIFPDRISRYFKQIIEAGATLGVTEKTERNRAIDIMMELKRQGSINASRKENGEKEHCLEITDEMLAGQAFIFYFAGYGNNSLLLSYALYYLAKNPEKQDILIQEIDEVMMKHDGKFSYESLKEMKYLEMVFEETLRLRPMTNAVVRNAARDVQLEGTDIIIPKNTILAISPYSFHHDEKYFPEPEKFKPERFSTENMREQHPCAMLSFGLGPRSCLGSKFALLQFSICMVKLLLKYRVECTKDTPESLTYTPTRLLLTPNERIYLRLVNRDK
ncbi:cytochrome P450 6B6-like [Spodoptera litura]|uniref:unspecific monooxygenase n=1 Tax=Spodoptera litura TaxID=69820 RepID=A0A3Q9D0K3_SPOLT|nr:cytochrome P450 6B6-like [Spodoptera litura]AZP54634.1 cytochrome p450 CYP6B50 [Spodoptera litura]